MDLRPLKRDGNTVTFVDGSYIDVFTLAREWGRRQEALYGDQCMAPECAETATTNATLFGHHVGRLCDAHLTVFTEVASR